MRILLAIFLSLVILVLGVAGAATLISLRPEVKPQSTAAVLPLVRAVEAHAETIELTVETQGTVAPRTESRLVAEVGGRVLEVSKSWVDGGFFDEGEVLLRLDATDYQLAEREAQTRITQAELRLAQEEADAEIALRDWRTERGSEEPPPLAVREPQLAEARATLAAARSALEKAHRDVERCTVVAPYPGRVRTTSVDVGEYVPPGAQLGHVYAVDAAEVRLPLPDAQLEYVELPLSYRGEQDGEAGPRVHLSTTFAGRKHTWEGRIVRTEGELDPSSRMVVAVARVEDPYGRGEVPDRPPLAKGMFVEAVIEGITVKDAVALPRSALRNGGRVYVLDEEDHLRFQEVDILRTERDRFLVRGGIEPGMQVIVSPLEEAVDGMHVRPVREGEEEQQ